MRERFMKTIRIAIYLVLAALGFIVQQRMVQLRAAAESCAEQGP